MPKVEPTPAVTPEVPPAEPVAAFPSEPVPPPVAPSAPPPKPKVVYPQSLLRKNDGNLQERVVTNAADEADARKQGYATLKELFPS